jgi:uncharacterized cupredoxin-like copper-binding protein
MNRLRLKFVLPALGLCLAAGLFASLGAGAVSAAVHATTTTKPTTIAVTAGKPAELAFKLSKFSNIAAGTVTFKVTNQGYAFHTFKICTSPVASAAKNSCVGKTTKLLKHGQSATLTVKLTKKGKYEYLCTVPGHAAGGMKGLIGVGVVVKAPVVTTTKSTTTTKTTTTSTTTTSTPTTTTTSPPPTTTTAGDGCPAGVTIATSGGTDNDTDENGAPSDNDGCI